MPTGIKVHEHIEKHTRLYFTGRREFSNRNETSRNSMNINIKREYSRERVPTGLFQTETNMTRQINFWCRMTIFNLLPHVSITFCIALFNQTTLS